MSVIMKTSKKFTNKTFMTFLSENKEKRQRDKEGSRELAICKGREKKVRKGWGKRVEEKG